MLRKPLYTVQDVAELLKVKEATVRGWIRSGELKGIHLSREWRVAVKDLEAFVASGAEQAGREVRAGGSVNERLAVECGPSAGTRPAARHSGAYGAAEKIPFDASMGPDVLVHIKASKPWTESIDVGLRLAQRLNGRAHGLLTQGDVARFKTLFSGDHALVAERQAGWDKSAREAEARFLEARDAIGVEGGWSVGEGHASELLSLAGRVHDLVVVEQNEPPVDEIDWDPAEETVLGSGVPTLVVPNKGAFPTLGRRIAIAWNQSREASLAVHGALALLQRAEHVVVLNGQRKEAFPSITRAPPHDLAAYLRRKGVAAEEVSLSSGDDEAGAGILKASRRWGADMLVMGAYGRSWFHEWMLGGATRYVLRHMDLPVLMAH